MTPLLRVSVPPSYPMERQYICAVLLGEFLGLDYRLEAAHRADVSITAAGGEQELVLPDLLFQTPGTHWLTPASLPAQPLDRWDLGQSPVSARVVSPTLPVLFGRPPYCDVADGRIALGVDLFGSAFFLLSRYEEVAKPDRDRWGRFPVTASLAFQAGFLERPLVNEYTEILWWALQRLWPGLRRKSRQTRTWLSHDADQPGPAREFGYLRVVRSAAGDLIRRRAPALVSQRLACNQAPDDGDLGNPFAFVMDTAERQGLQCSFHFTAASIARPAAIGSDLGAPWTHRLMRRVRDRGHELSLQVRAGSYRSGSQVAQEFAQLRTAGAREGIEQAKWCGRCDGLRWEAPTSWAAWDEAGLDYDSTLAYPDRPGFRSATCYEHPVFDLRQRRTLRLRERPLVVSAELLLAEKGRSPDDAAGEIRRLRRICRHFDGDFTLLWQAGNLVHRSERDAFRSIVGEC